MSNFSAAIHQNPTHTLITLSGTLSEDSILPDIDPKLPATLNFNKVSRINSRGIKIWYTWIARFKDPMRIRLQECPAIVIKSFNLVKGCFPAIVQVDSFYVPVFSEITGERKDVLLTRGKEFDSAKVTVPEQKDSKGNLMEVDVHDSYWAFSKLS